MTELHNLEDLKYEDSKDSQIVIIDSGLGGLLALNKLSEEFPIENFLYICDNQMLPIGNKNQNLINNRVNKIARYLKKIKPKCIVLACNTIDSISYDSLSSSFPNIKVYSIIIPTIEKAIENSRNIAILGTKNTIESQAYPKYAVGKSNVNMYGVECIELAKSIENNEDYMSVLKKETKVLNDIDYDTLVLGCTHYSIIQKDIQKIFKDKEIIDSTEELVNSVVDNFEDNIKNRANKQKIQIVVTEDEQIIKDNIKKMIKKESDIYNIKI